MSNFAEFELAIAADDQVVAVGAVEAEDVEDDDALGGVDDLADAEERFALGDARSSAVRGSATVASTSSSE